MNDKEMRSLNSHGTKKYSTDELIDYADNYCIAGLPPHPVVASKASGSYIWDLDGNKYIDLIAAYSSANQGEKDLSKSTTQGERGDNIVEHADLDYQPK